MKSVLASHNNNNNKNNTAQSPYTSSHHSPLVPSTKVILEGWKISRVISRRTLSLPHLGNLSPHLLCVWFCRSKKKRRAETHTKLAACRSTTLQNWLHLPATGPRNFLLCFYNGCCNLTKGQMRLLLVQSNNQIYFWSRKLANPTRRRSRDSIDTVLTDGTAAQLRPQSNTSFL